MTPTPTNQHTKYHSDAVLAVVVFAGCSYGTAMFSHTFKARSNPMAYLAIFTFTVILSLSANKALSAMVKMSWNEQGVKMISKIFPHFIEFSQVKIAISRNRYFSKSIIFYVLSNRSIYLYSIGNKDFTTAELRNVFHSLQHAGQLLDRVPPIQLFIYSLKSNFVFFSLSLLIKLIFFYPFSTLSAVYYMVAYVVASFAFFLAISLEAQLCRVAFEPSSIPPAPYRDAEK